MKDEPSFHALIDIATRHIERQTAALKAKLLNRALDRALLLLRYDPAQPRVPAGNPDGGQWVDWPASGRNQRRRSRQAQWGKQRFSGPLVRQNRDTKTGVLYCTFYDSKNDYAFTVAYWDALKCPIGYVNY